MSAPAVPIFLKPCPFCRSILDSTKDTTFRYVDGGKKWGAVMCCIQGPDVRTGFRPAPEWHQAAADEWNDRGGEDEGAVTPEAVRAAARYELVRTLSPRDFSAMWTENLQTGKPFDDLVDEKIAERAKQRSPAR